MNRRERGTRRRSAKDDVPNGSRIVPSYSLMCVHIRVLLLAPALELESTFNKYVDNNDF